MTPSNFPSSQHISVSPGIRDHYRSRDRRLFPNGTSNIYLFIYLLLRGHAACVPTFTWLINVNITNSQIIALSKANKRASMFITGAFCIGNILIYCTFVLLILLFELVTSESSNQHCGYREAQTTDTQPQFIISVSYRVFVAVIALAIGVGFLLFGGKIWNKVTDNTMQH